MASKSPEPGQPALKAADLRAINQALYRLSQANDQIDQAEKAGLDVQQLRDLHAENLLKLTALKQVYFPGEQ